MDTEASHIQFHEDVTEHEKQPYKGGLQSPSKRRISIQEADTESCFSEKGTDVRESDFKKRQVFKGWTLLWLSYQATGVIYGDIGTVRQSTPQKHTFVLTVLVTLICLLFVFLFASGSCRLTRRSLDYYLVFDAHRHREVHAYRAPRGRRGRRRDLCSLHVNLALLQRDSK